jgi:hypothetical protein
MSLAGRSLPDRSARRRYAHAARASHFAGIGPASGQWQALASSPGPASVQLYRYVRHDVEHLVGSPFDLQGMYSEEVMGDPQFAAWSQERIRVHAAVERIVEDGVASGGLPADRDGPGHRQHPAGSQELAIHDVFALTTTTSTTAAGTTGSVRGRRTGRRQ